MGMIQFRVYGVPVQEGNIRAWSNKKNGAVHYSHANEKTLKPYRYRIEDQARAIMQANGLTMPEGAYYVVDMSFAFAKPKSAPKKRAIRHTKRPDLDKLVRSVLDALTDVVFRDDSQVNSFTASKFYVDDGMPYTDITVSSPAFDKATAIEVLE